MHVMIFNSGNGWSLKKRGVRSYCIRPSFWWGKMHGLYVLPLLQRSAQRDMNVTELEAPRIWYSFNSKQSVVRARVEVRTGELGATLALLVSSNEAR